MKDDFKYTLSQNWIDKIKHMDEFSNGGTQVTIRLKNGKTFEKVLISNCKWIIAIRGYSDLPFSLDSIDDIYQTEQDKNPSERGNWNFFGLPN